MSTQCLIGITTEQNEVRCVYCHSDGYPSYTGDLLLNYYNTRQKAEALIALGDLSLLGKFVAPEKELAMPSHDNYREPTQPTPHSFSTPHPNVTIAYHRDRNDKLNIGHEFSEKRYYRINYKHYPFIYLFKDDKWYVNDKVLTEEIINL